MVISCGGLLLTKTFATAKFRNFIFEIAFSIRLPSNIPTKTKCIVIINSLGPHIPSPKSICQIWNHQLSNQYSKPVWRQYWLAEKSCWFCRVSCDRGDREWSSVLDLSTAQITFLDGTLAPGCWSGNILEYWPRLMRGHRHIPRPGRIYPNLFVFISNMPVTDLWRAYVSQIRWSAWIMTQIPHSLSQGKFPAGCPWKQYRKSKRPRTKRV